MFNQLVLNKRNLLTGTIASMTFCMLAVSSAYAVNSVVIDQVGEGSIEINQSGKENTTEIHQNPGDPAPVHTDSSKMEDPPLGTPPSPVTTRDYQKTILQNPYTSPVARAQVLATQKDAAQQDAAKKDTKKLVETEQKTAHKIHVTQTGDSNSASTSQTGGTNDLLIEQQGKYNEAVRNQSGTDNHSRILQNGDVVEDTQTGK